MGHNRWKTCAELVWAYGPKEPTCSVVNTQRPRKGLKQVSFHGWLWEGFLKPIVPNALKPLESFTCVLCFRVPEANYEACSMWNAVEKYLSKPSSNPIGTQQLEIHAAFPQNLAVMPSTPWSQPFNAVETASCVDQIPLVHGSVESERVCAMTVAKQGWRTELGQAVKPILPTL